MAVDRYARRAFVGPRYGDIAEFQARYGHDVDDGPQRGLRSLLGTRPDDPLGRRLWDVLAHQAAEVGMYQTQAGPRPLGRIRRSRAGDDVPELADGASYLFGQHVVVEQRSIGERRQRFASGCGVAEDQPG